MNTFYETPQSRRGKIVFFFWHNLPRFVLLAMIGLIVFLALSISGKKSAIQADQAAAIKKERPPVNTVTMKAQPTTISNRINLPGSIEPWTRLDLTAKIAGGSCMFDLAGEGQGDIGQRRHGLTQLRGEFIQPPNGRGQGIVQAGDTHLECYPRLAAESCNPRRRRREE